VRKYELTLILNSQLAEDQIETTLKKMSDLLVSNGAEIVQVERWGIRKLAYEIKKHQQGFYTLIQFTTEGNVVPAVEQACHLEEGILRSMIVVRKQLTSREEATRQEVGGGLPKPPVAVEKNDPVAVPSETPETNVVEPEKEV
jgi:small subunit ribosomal protein S6